MRTLIPSAIGGTVVAPGSKSVMQRALAAASLSAGATTIINPFYCDDTDAALRLVSCLGATIQPVQQGLMIKGHGMVKNKVLDCGESGLAIRMFSPIAALHKEEVLLTGHGSLILRPMDMIPDALNQAGVSCSITNGFLPVKIQGPLKGGHIIIDGSVSSQLLTGLLMALPLAKENSVVMVKALKSKPYIDLTLSLMSLFGVEVQQEGNSIFNIRSGQEYTATPIHIEGDWSGAAFLLVAGAIGGTITVTNLDNTSKQADKKITEALEQAGALVNINASSVTVKKVRLKAFRFDAEACPDLFPPLVALAANCNGTSIIKGAGRLTHKESDRGQALRKEFKKLGIEIELNGDEMIIHGGKITGGTVSSHHDHRIAMALAVAGLNGSEHTLIENDACISKSYPAFFTDLQSVCMTKTNTTI